MLLNILESLDQPNKRRSHWGNNEQEEVLKIVMKLIKVLQTVVLADLSSVNRYQNNIYYHNQSSHMENPLILGYVSHYCCNLRRKSVFLKSGKLKCNTFAELFGCSQ